MMMCFAVLKKETDEAVVIDPCTPRGYKWSLEERQHHAVSVSTATHSLVSSIVSQGNFSECRSAAYSLLQKDQGTKWPQPLSVHWESSVTLILTEGTNWDFFFMIDISFMGIVPCAWQFALVSWGADDCTYPKCAMGTAFVPELRGNFFATENCFYTSEVVLYPVVVVAVMIVTDRLLLTHAFSQLNSCWIQNEIQHWKRVKNADKISNRHDLCALWAYTVFLLSSSFLNCLSRHHWRRL